MSIEPKVAIIVLNYNGADCLPSCLRSLHQLSYSNKEIIVVDNHSTDHSFRQVKQQFPQCIFIENKENLGFSKGMNVGIKEALSCGAEYCLLFNYDAEIDSEALSLLVSAGEKHSHAGLLSPVVYEEEKKKIWFAQGRVLFSRMRAIHTKPSLTEQNKDTYTSNFLTGCALLIKKELIEKIGFLDECFFLYYEDVDYSFRAREAGFDLLVVSGAKVYHREKSNENPQKVYFLVLSGLIFFQKHTPFFLRPHIALYVRIRRAKNLFDRKVWKTPASEQVYRAYNDFFNEYPTAYFSYLRQLSERLLSKIRSGKHLFF
ncbi:MAG: glycosyltransferase family 2 protein [Candidatus Moranbacteria bacterium]|nr:glycosyltransferase family 2 protein [Candidatus Moranbacteria bacterium]MDD3964621.1 glycosyltransferase family 2 protein [Candidatus Moranbacteria bacterium]